MLIIYFLVALSVIKLRYKQKSKPTEFKIPGGLLIPILSIAIILYFLSNLALNEMIGTAIFIAVLSIIHIVIRFLKAKK